MARHAEGRRERPRARCSARARRWRSPPGTAAPPGSRRQGERRPRPRPGASGAAARRPSSSASPRCARDGRVQPLRLPAAGRRRAARARLRRRRATPRARRCACSRRSRTAAPGASPGSMRPYVFVDEWDVARPARGRLRRASPTRAPTREWWQPGLHRRRRRRPGRARQGVAPALQGPPALPPAHALDGSCALERAAPRRRPTSTATCAGAAIWTLTPTGDGGTHVRFDWQVHADRRLLRAAHAGAAPGLPLEPQLGDRARDGGPGALRAAHRLTGLSRRTSRRSPRRTSRRSACA